MLVQKCSLQSKIPHYRGALNLQIKITAKLRLKKVSLGNILQLYI